MKNVNNLLISVPCYVIVSIKSIILASLYKITMRTLHFEVHYLVHLSIFFFFFFFKGGWLELILDSFRTKIEIKSDVKCLWSLQLWYFLLAVSSILCIIIHDENKIIRFDKVEQIYCTWKMIHTNSFWRTISFLSPVLHFRWEHQQKVSIRTCFDSQLHLSAHPGPYSKL